MAWRQLIDANPGVGYVGGWCLKYVQDAFGTDHVYPTALDAWNANYGGGNHPDEEPPLGITVPIYLSLGNVPAGHVAIRLDDGYVASSTQPGEHSNAYYHRSIADLVALYGQYNGGANYLGWSEYVGTQKVVDFTSDVPVNIDEQPTPNPVVAPIHNPDVAPTPEPVVVPPAPVPTPVVLPTPEPVVVPVPTPEPVVPKVKPVTKPTPIKKTWLTLLLDWIVKWWAK